MINPKKTKKIEIKNIEKINHEIETLMSILKENHDGETWREENVGKIKDAVNCYYIPENDRLLTLLREKLKPQHFQAIEATMRAFKKSIPK